MAETQTPAKASRATKKAAPGRPPGTRVSDEQKAAMAQGRLESGKVRAYLEGLEAQNGSKRRGRRRTPESIEARLAEIGDAFAQADAMTKLKMTQERLDLEAELADLTGEAEVDIESLQKDFVTVAKSFAARQGITYQAWREIGVPPMVLQEAGITRSGV